MAETHQVVVIGGGFGGLSAVQALAGAPVSVLLVDRRNHHLFQPLLYQVATSVLSTTEIAWPIRHILRKQRNAQVLLGTVTGIDKHARQVRLEDGSTLAYDTLIVATGATHSYFGNDHWAALAPGLKTLEDATRIRRHLLLAFEAAERAKDPAERRALLTFVIIGAGPTGVEMAGAISELARSSLAGDFRTLAPNDARVILVEGIDRVLGNFEPELSDYAFRALKKLGVEIRLDSPVTGIDADGVSLADGRIETKTVIWGAGVAASPAAKWLDVKADKAGRVLVAPNLTLPEHPDIFVDGDTAAMRKPDGKPVPGIAPAAKQAGAFAATVIRERLAGKVPPAQFAYHHAGDLATIGRAKAVIDFGTVKLKGALAWWVWGVAHVYFLIGGKNRLSVALSWLWIYLTGTRSARLITQGDADTRAPIAELTEPPPTD